MNIKQKRKRALYKVCYGGNPTQFERTLLRGSGRWRTFTSGRITAREIRFYA